MNKDKKKNIIILFLCYFFSLFLFELIIGERRCDSVMEYYAQKGGDSPFIVFESFFQAGMFHFVFVLILAVASLFIKKLDKEYKFVLFIFPVLTFYLSLPMGFLTLTLCNFIGLYD